MEEDGEALPEVAGGHTLVLAGVPGERHGELVDLLDRHGVPSPEGLGGQREEHDPLALAVGSCGDHLAVVGLGRGVARGGGGSGHRGILKGMGHRHVQSRVLATGFAIGLALAFVGQIWSPARAGRLPPPLDVSVILKAMMD